MTRLPVRPFLLMIIVAFSIAPACSTDSGTTVPGDSFWASLRIGGAAEAEHFERLSDMAESADSVVLGRITGFEMTRALQGDAQEDVVVYGKATLEIREVLAGRDFGRIIPLEFLVPATTEAQAESAIAELRMALPRQELIVFLRNKGGSESDFFRATNSVGLWASTMRSQLDTPLAELSPEESKVFDQELAGVDSISDLNELIAGYHL